ncbi:MAG: hypothetical protein Q9168_003579 [Polycauliona sp. 1 TL-2023]
MSLEVDQPGKEPVTYYHDHYNGIETVNGPDYHHVKSHPAQTHSPQSTPPSQTHRKRSSLVTALLAALVIMTILAIVAAAVGGSTAVKRQSSIDRLRQQLNDSQEALRSFANSDNHTSSPTPRPAKLSDIEPTSNCSDIGDKSTYVSALTQMPFTVHCETDYTGSDILGVWIFTFADCMEACASWNSHQNSPRCYAVSYDVSGLFAEERGSGNCFLKGARNIPAHSKNVTSSADALFSGNS